MAGTTRACRRSPVCAGAGSRRPASVCSVNASAYRKPTRGSISAYLNRRCAMILERALRKDLEPRAPRRMAVLDPIKLVIDNYLDGAIEWCRAPIHPHGGGGLRAFPFSRELWIEREDFCEHPPKGYFRLF